MNSGKIVAGGRDGWTGEIDGSTRGPRGPKNYTNQLNLRTVKTIFIYVGSKINYTLPFFFSLNAFFHVNKGTSQALVLGTRK